jgi:hypothetical protein
MTVRLILTLALMASVMAITAPASAGNWYVAQDTFNSTSLQPPVRLVADTAATGHWYVIQNKEGTTKLSDKKPGLGWGVIGGPYNSWDQAARAGGVAPHGGVSVGPYNR